MDALQGKLNTLKQKAIINNSNLEKILDRIPIRINELIQEKTAKITELQEQITNFRDNPDVTNATILELQRELTLKNNEIQALNTVSAEINNIILEIQGQLNTTDNKIRNATGELEFTPTFLPNPTDFTGGKSTKRKRHHKKHSKGKSRNIRNKKHKSK